MKRRDEERNCLPWFQVALAFLLLLAAGALFFQVLQKGQGGFMVGGEGKAATDWQRITAETLRTWPPGWELAQNPAGWFAAILVNTLWRLGELYGSLLFLVF